jgi:calcineurin-like phosphoesterase family protein
MQTWLISDTHFGHKNIVEYCKRPVNHNELMVENWQKLVAPEDSIFHLGDVFMGKGSKEFAQSIVPELPGQKYLIPGNHDTESKEFYESLGFHLAWQPFYFNEGLCFTHYPLCRDYAKWKTNIHGHIHNQGYAPGTPPKRSYVNVSVEVTGYAPVLLEDVKKGLVGQTRQEAGNWPATMFIEMYQKGRLDEHFCEKERLDKAPTI